jgi:DNA polymerase III delta prime subunit
MSSIPWTEAYRPTNFDDIVLEPLNKKILTNIIVTGYFPNLLFFGPPGTGKTTTIINLIDKYQEQHGQKNKGLMIHLNASDERGIDIIRNQINQFVNSKSLFNTGMKFVILDEVDYMTKNAQQALRYLLQNYTSGVRFCLICNYISRIDEGLQNEFMRLRFNQLPESDIISFLLSISKSENLSLTEKSLHLIQKLYKSDIRSMINFMQSNQDVNPDDFNIIDSTVWDILYCKIQSNISLSIIVNDVNGMSMKYNIDKKNLIKDFLNYIIRNKSDKPEIYKKMPDHLNFIENIMHFEDCKDSYYVGYSISQLSSLINEKENLEKSESKESVSKESESKELGSKESEVESEAQDGEL